MIRDPIVELGVLGIYAADSEVIKEWFETLSAAEQLQVITYIDGVLVKIVEVWHAFKEEVYETS